MEPIARHGVANHGTGGPRYVLPTPVLLEGYNATTGFTFNNGTGALDTVNKVEGAGAIKIQQTTTGVGARLDKVFAAPVAAADMGVIAYYVAITETWGTFNMVQTQFGNGTTLSAPTVNVAQQTFGTGFWDEGYWKAFHVSEEASIGALSGNVTNIRQTFTGNAPACARVSSDAMYRNAAGRPTLIITFDDAIDSTNTVALPSMAPYGMRGTCYPPTANLSTVDGTHQSLAQLQELYAAGWDIGVDGTTDDAQMTTHGTVAAAITNINVNRDFLIANGMPRAADHLCYPNGVYAVGGTRVQVAAATANGTTTVTFSAAATGLVAGMAAIGLNVAAGTTVVSVAGDLLSAVLSSTVVAQTKAMMFEDQSGEFMWPKLPAALAAAGYKTARTTQGQSQPMYTRFGLGTKALTLPAGSGASATYAGLKAYVDMTILRGATGILYFHGIGAGKPLTVDATVWQQFVDYVGGLKNAGTLDVMTISEFYARDSVATVPS